MSIQEANELLESPTTQKLIDNANGGNINYQDHHRSMWAADHLGRHDACKSNYQWYCQRSIYAAIGGIVAEFSANKEMSRIKGLADELFERVLYDEEPLFVSDETTLWASQCPMWTRC